MTRNDNISVYNLLTGLEERLNDLESRILRIEGRLNPAVDDRMASFLRIPYKIRRSLFAVAQLGEGTAVEVGMITDRHMSLENRYLNELVRSGWLERKRIGKKIYYCLKKTVGFSKTKYQLMLDDSE